MATDNKGDVYGKTRGALISVVLLVSVVSVQLWLSVFLYFTFYYMYMPVEKFEQPVFLEYSPCRQFTGVESCPFPGSNISLMGDYTQGRVLMRGQKYDILLNMDLPQSPVNVKQGVFMVEISLYSEHGQVTASAAKPVMLKYRSPILRVLDTLLYVPLFLVGYRDESEHFSVTLMEDFVDNPTKPVYGAYIEVRARQVEIYSIKFLIRAHFSGLRYFLFYWPLTSALFSVVFNFSILSIISFLSWGQIRAFTFGGAQPKVLEDPPWVKRRKEAGPAADAPRVAELKGVRKMEHRKDILADLRTSMGGERPRPSGSRRDVSYCDSDDDDDILCAPDSPRGSLSMTTKEGSSDSFEAIEDSTEEGTVRGRAEGGRSGVRYRSGRTSSPD